VAANARSRIEVAELWPHTVEIESVWLGYGPRRAPGFLPAHFVFVTSFPKLPPLVPKVSEALWER